MFPSADDFPTAYEHQPLTTDGSTKPVAPLTKAISRASAAVSRQTPAQRYNLSGRFGVD